MDSSVSLKDEIWYLRVRHHISNTVYFRNGITTNTTAQCHNTSNHSKNPK